MVDKRSNTVKTEIVTTLRLVTEEFANLQYRSEAAIEEAKALRSQGYQVSPESILLQMCAVFGRRSKDLVTAIYGNDADETTRVLLLTNDDFRQLDEQDFSWSAALEGGLLLKRTETRIFSLLFESGNTGEFTRRLESE